MESLLNPFYHSHFNTEEKGSFGRLFIALLFLFPLIFQLRRRLDFSARGAMTTKIKGLYQGIKYISHIFVVKERELEIGYPTDVKHVAHIGWDGPSGSGPTWMNEFKAAPEFSSSLGTISEPRDSKPSSISSSRTGSQDSGEALGRQASDTMRDKPPSELPKAPKKQKRRKTKSSASPKSSSASRSSRATKTRSKFAETEKSLILQ